jgi:hypothetical protein
MGARELETGETMIKRGGVPGFRGMTLCARMAIIPRDVIRVGRPVEIGLMTTVTICRQAAAVLTV